MALRPSKITSEILQNCNKFFSSNTDVHLKSKIRVAVASQKDPIKTQSAFRYTIANTGKPAGLPELNFQEESSTLFAELQPSANPEFRFDHIPLKWAEKPAHSSPFPASIKQKNRFHATYSDLQKAEDKMMQYKMDYFKTSSRKYSTASVRSYSRGPAENSGSGNCKTKPNPCYKTKHKNCKLNKSCARLKLLDCEQSPGSNCKLNYLDPNCAKKFAPYPSYSESCAEDLPEDPSECQQCPWRTCDGADTITPGKPVRNKRTYSTSCSTHLEATSGVVIGPLLPPPLADVQNYLSKGKCDHDKHPCGQVKQPCKQPPGPCEVRRINEEAQRREREPHVPPRPKKASEEGLGMVLTSAYAEEPTRSAMDGPSIENKSSWIDLNEGEEMFLEKKQKPPHCQRKKKPKRPPDADFDQSNIDIEIGTPEWWTGRGKKAVIIGNKDPSDTRNCRVEKCREMTIKTREEVSKKSWKKKNKSVDQVKNHTTPFQYRR